jgi:hypothetical protein
MMKKEKRGVDSNLITNNKTQEKIENKTSEKNIEVKSEKITRPVKWNKNKHSFIVSGKIYTLIIYRDYFRSRRKISIHKTNRSGGLRCRLFLFR